MVQLVLDDVGLVCVLQLLVPRLCMTSLAVFQLLVGFAYEGDEKQNVCSRVNVGRTPRCPALPACRCKGRSSCHHPHGPDMC